MSAFAVAVTDSQPPKARGVTIEYDEGAENLDVTCTLD
jgi:hypothetical protein